MLGSPEGFIVAIRGEWGKLVVHTVYSFISTSSNTAIKESPRELKMYSASPDQLLRPAPGYFVIQILHTGHHAQYGYPYTLWAGAIHTGAAFVEHLMLHTPRAINKWNIKSKLDHFSCVCCNHVHCTVNTE